MEHQTADAILQSLLDKGGAIIHTGQVPDPVVATILAMGTQSDSFVREDGIAFVRVAEQQNG